MQQDNVIEVRNVKKTFKTYKNRGNTLKETLLRLKQIKAEKREVLKDISFDVKRGEAVALIGGNGCGKSTTLKLLSKILYPDSGTIEMKGRVVGLIELGAGFHPDLSGRENIYINASIFGLKKSEIEKRIPEIIAFSELEEFIDSPVRTYSSGMYMRLAFAVAINIGADILLVDEILAVGDAAFQAKCFDKIREVKASGTAIVIVSHDTAQIERVCDKCIWICDGLIRQSGRPADVDSLYLEYLGEKKNREQKEIEPGCENAVDENKPVQILSAGLYVDGEYKTNIRTGDEVCLRIKYRKNEDVINPVLGIKIYRNDNVVAYGINSTNDRQRFTLAKDGVIEVIFPQWNFVQGKYYIDVAVRKENMMICDYQTRVVSFTTYFSCNEDGIAHLDHVWSWNNE